MVGLYRLFNSWIVSLLALFFPVRPAILCTLCFVAIDFISGVVASRAVAMREGRKWYFESREAWRTIHKLCFIVIALSLMWLLERCVLDFATFNITKIFAGFICTIELWSLLENISQLSDAPIFEWMRRYLHRRIEKQIDNVI